MKLLVVLFLLVSTARAFVVLPSASMPTSTRLFLYDSVETAIAEAQKLCEENPNSKECKVAWDIVEELEAADSHKGAPQGPTGITADAEYKSLLDSFDILMDRTSDKLDQLKAVTVRLEDLGVNDPRVSQLYDHSETLKQALVQAKVSLYNE